MAHTIHEMYVGAQPYNWYNLSRSGGQNATNLYDDVCLVQILIVQLNFELWERARAAHEGIPTDLRTTPFLRASLKRVI